MKGPEYMLTIMSMWVIDKEMEDHGNKQNWDGHTTIFKMEV